MSQRVEAGLAARALHSAAVLTLVSYATALISFPLNLGLVRMVGPADYGRFALAAAVMQAIYLAGGWSFNVCLAVSPPDPVLEDAALCLTLMLGLGLGLAAWLVSPLIGRRLGPAVADLTLGLAVIRIANLVAYLYGGLLERKLHYRAFALVDGAASVLSFVPALWLGHRGRGAWALVGREAALAGMALVGYRLCLRRAPRLRWDRRAARQLLGQGAPLAAMHSCMAAFYNADRLALGLVLSPVMVGLYSQARFLADGIGTILAPLVTQVAVPIYARSAAGRASEELYRLFAFVAVRVAAGPLLLFSFFPRLLVHLLYGPRWAAVASLLPCFGLYVAMVPLVENQRSRATGLGQRRCLIGLSLSMAIAAAAAPLSAWWWRSPRACGWTVTGAMALVLVAGHRLSACRVGYGALLGPPILAMAGAALGGQALIRTGSCSEGLVMGLTMLAYGLLLAAIEWRELRRLGQVLRQPGPADEATSPGLPDYGTVR